LEFRPALFLPERASQMGSAPGTDAGGAGRRTSFTAPKSSTAENGKGKGSAIAGLVLCVIGTVCSGIGVFVCTACVAAGAGAAAKTPDALQSLQGAAESLQKTKDALEGLKN
jgi:hypothetical protein